MSTNNHKRWFFAGWCICHRASRFSFGFHRAELAHSRPVVSARGFRRKQYEKRRRCQGLKIPPRNRPFPVTVAKVELHSIQRSVDVVGSFEGYEELTVTPKVDGRVIRVHCDVGDVVRQGDLLIEIDPTDYTLRRRRSAKEDRNRISQGRFDRLARPRLRHYEIAHRGPRIPLNTETPR